MMIKKFDVNEIRKDFPILQRKINNNKLVYLDNAATSQKPTSVINSLSDYYSSYNSNVHRGVHTLSVEATDKYEMARNKVSTFLDCKPQEVIWTRNTSESLNIVSIGLKKSIKATDNIVISKMEHHSNLVPWQQLCLETGATLRYLNHNLDGKIDLTEAEKVKKSQSKSFILTGK